MCSPVRVGMGTNKQTIATESIQADINSTLAMCDDIEGCIDEALALLDSATAVDDGFPFLSEPCQVRRFPAVFK